MKHLLIILSILLLSSPLFGDNHKGEILYRNWNFVWRDYDDEEKDLKYVGKTRNGKPIGQGTQT